ncbi:hypothetical protein CAL22_05880 [Bordetella genomosp. 12]|uniref:Transglutaminase-like domain-containing protein n=1 Tax=Bordetella genomosp. 12 TaxID=463035 RepID=A0A261VIQ8_9BORD|nr:hypothetical protein CAL22_05880 [Bordetella genomosp. 12]
MDSPDPELEYQVLVRFRPDAGESKPELPWTPVTDYSSSGAFSLPMDGSGVFDFHLNARRKSDQTQVLNKYLGQMDTVSDADLSNTTFYPSQYLKTYNVPTTYYLDMFQRKEQIKEIHTNKGLAAFIKRKFKPEVFPDSVRGLPRDLVLALHAMNSINAMYHYGNVVDSEGAGCVLLNEGDKKVESFAQFVDSYVACCIDYVMLLKYVLDQYGIKSELATIPNHVYLNVIVDGETYTLDPTVNMAFIGGIIDVLDRKGGYILTFPMVAETQGNRYESMPASNFRRKMIAWVGLAGSDQVGPGPVVMSEPAYPFIYGVPRQNAAAQ